MQFAELPAHPALKRALAEKGYEQATPVQSAVLAEEHIGRDLLVSAQTGSGKTVAFGLVLARNLLADAERLPPAGRPLALVIAPTRELAMQVQRELSWLYAPAGGRVTTCVGGMDIGRERRALSEGAHIVVGTPGRLVDHLERRSLVLDHLRAVVLDEADEMLDMGFRDELERILKDAPAERHTLLFSATIPKGIAELAERYQKDAARIAATPTAQAHADIEYRAHLIAVREREHAVVNVLRGFDASAAIVFCQTREGVNHLHANLLERGFEAVALSGDLSQAERTRALKSLRDGRARVLVATDVAARGLDLPALGLVIHADLPVDSAVLQHRSGRTGRAGRKGVSVLLAPPARRRHAERLIREARVRVGWTPVPSAEAIRALDQERIAEEIKSHAVEASEADLEVARKLLEQSTPEQLAALLVSLHRGRMPAPEELPLSAGLGSTDRAPRTPRQHGDDERPFRPFGSFEDRPKRSFEERPQRSFEERPQRSFDDRPKRFNDERPQRSFEERPQRPFAERPQRSFEERPQRSFEERPQRSFERAPSRFGHDGAAEGRPHRESSFQRKPRENGFSHQAREGGFEAPQRDRRPPTRAAGSEDGATWFSVNVGRTANADPRWLIPMLCRRGQVTKSDIGAIKILPDETRVEIAPHAAERFARSTRSPDRQDPRIRISPSRAPMFRDPR